MASMVNAVAVIAADVGGRGDNPSEGGGLLMILLVVAVVLAGGLLLVAFFRRGRARRRVLQRHPDREGRVGRVGEFRGQ
jgi:hypothetical protein